MDKDKIYPQKWKEMGGKKREKLTPISALCHSAKILSDIKPVLKEKGLGLLIYSTAVEKFYLS